ncbi:MAG: hypothetical protein PHF44_04645 [Candidatus Pacebacteria bacterium]|nr:hypothetical protein [Candidatus Paceibacterota bacterium]
MKQIKANKEWDDYLRKEKNEKEKLKNLDEERKKIAEIISKAKEEEENNQRKRIIEEKKELDRRNYEKGINLLSVKNLAGALRSFKAVHGDSPCYQDALRYISEISKDILEIENKLNYEQGLKEFNNKDWEKVINFLGEGFYGSPYYFDSQSRLKKAREKLKQWENIISKIKLLNYQACKLKEKNEKEENEGEFDLPPLKRIGNLEIFEAIDDEKFYEEFNDLALLIKKLFKQAEEIYPAKTKEFIKSVLRKKKYKDDIKYIKIANELATRGIGGLADYYWTRW